MAKQKPPADGYARLNAAVGEAVGEAATDEFDLTGAEATPPPTVVTDDIGEALMAAAVDGRVVIERRHPDDEAPCEPGGNHGLCRTHPTCEMVRRMLTDALGAVAANSDAGAVLASKALIRDCHGLLSRLVTGHLIHPTNYDANRHARELLTRLAAAVG